MRTAIFAALVCLVSPPHAIGQTAFFTTGGGVSAGDGGPAGPVVVSAGYLTQRAIGFELEFGFTHGLEFPGPDVVIQQTVFPSIFPPTTFDSRGRLFTLHTNLLYPVPSGGRLRVTAVAGGGVANVEQRVRIQRPEVIIPLPPEVTVPLPGNIGFEPFTIPAIDLRRTNSHTGLSLNAGGTIEYALTERLAAGVDARYQHVFLDNGGMDLARVTGRVSWRF